jgi:hypothetical protein
MSSSDRNELRERLDRLDRKVQWLVRSLIEIAAIVFGYGAYAGLRDYWQFPETISFGGAVLFGVIIFVILSYDSNR